MLKLGDSLGSFIILELLDEGGMGEVYIGFDGKKKKLVAIKTLFQKRNRSQEYLRRFKREADVYSKLSHPNIVRFVDAGFDNDRYFIAMEHINGLSLDAIIKGKGRLGFDFSVKIAGNLADAIAHAHERGVIHRDIKPQNIKLSEEGTVKLLDFGIAHREDGIVETPTGMILGTFPYSSPEQNQGKKIDERSDIYSLGTVLYEMLTGHRALKGSNHAEVTGFQVHGTIPRPSVHIGEIPEGLDKIVMKMLELNPSKRYGSAIELIKDLQAFKDDPNFDPETGLFSSKEMTQWWDAANEHYKKGEHDRVIACVTKLLEKKRDNAKVHLLAGKSYAALGAASQAMDHLRQVGQLADENKGLMLEVGICLFNLNMLTEAREKISQYLDFDCDNLYAKHYLSRIDEVERKERQKEEDAAVERLRALRKKNED